MVHQTKALNRKPSSGERSALIDRQTKGKTWSSLLGVKKGGKRQNNDQVYHLLFSRSFKFAHLRRKYLLFGRKHAPFSIIPGRTMFPLLWVSDCSPGLGEDSLEWKTEADSFWGKILDIYSRQPRMANTENMPKRSREAQKGIRPQYNKFGQVVKVAKQLCYEQRFLRACWFIAECSSSYFNMEKYVLLVVWWDGTTLKENIPFVSSLFFSTGFLRWNIVSCVLSCDNDRLVLFE